MLRVLLVTFVLLLTLLVVWHQRSDVAFVFALCIFMAVPAWLDKRHHKKPQAAAALISAPVIKQKPILAVPAGLPILRGWVHGTHVSREMAEGFVKASVWWDHPSGSLVRAPRHAKNLEFTTHNGWQLPLGANRVLVSKIIQRARHIFVKAASTGELSSGILLKALEGAVSGSIANVHGDEYYIYPDRDGYLEFGTQRLCLSDAAKYLMKEAGLSL